MTDNNDPALTKSPLTTAEVYAMALRRLADKKAEPPVAAAVPTPSLRRSLNAPATPQEPVQRPASGWKRIVLPWHEPLTIDDIRDDFNNGLIAAGSPQGAAIYAGEGTDQGAEVIFSPAAAVIFRTMKIMQHAVDCAQPASSEATLLCGDGTGP